MQRNSPNPQEIAGMILLGVVGVGLGVVAAFVATMIASSGLMTMRQIAAAGFTVIMALVVREALK